MTGAPAPGGGAAAELRAAVADGRTRDAGWRVRQLAGIERMLAEQEARICAALADDLGRAAADSVVAEILPSRGEAVHARRNVHRWMRRRRVGLPLVQRPGAAWVQPEPLGAVLVVAPWNYPLYLLLGPLVAAVAAGNAVALKPSELAPATSALIAELAPRHLDAEAVRVVPGDAATTQALIASGFDHLVFTGGTRVGREIMRAAADTLTPVTLELGGKSPVIVAADADLDVAARRVAWGKVLNAGQTCVAPDYALVDRSVLPEFVDRVGRHLEALRAGDDPAGARIVNDRQFARLTAALAATRGSVVHGGTSDAGALRIAPAVVVAPDPDEPLMTDEIFGPVLPVVPVDDVDAALRFVLARPKPLAAYVFGADRAATARVADALPAGAVVVNHVVLHVAVPQLPFGGVGPSGTGAYHGVWGFDRLSHLKPVLTRSTRPDPGFAYPPYGRGALSLLRRLL